jgi:tetratricopeptide (TPR) repeat protein
VDDLKELGGSVSIDLDSLDAEDGAKYLEHLGVKGTPEERCEVSREMGGHALALTLLGTYLAIGYDGDIRRRDLVPGLMAEVKQGGHARRVMQAYEKWFEGKPEGDILRLMGLFDRPPDAGAIRVLREPPAMPGLTERLQNLSDYAWNVALDNLRRTRLLAAGLDCHPLVREHFGDQLKSAAPAAWKEAHRRLYEYYKAQAKEYPDTIEEMAPLYAAVAHGCQAGRHQETLDDVYWRRIQRGNEFFNTKKLGAISADLAAIAGFFDSPWEKPVAGLRDSDAALLLNQAGIALRALSRLREAGQPLKAGLEARIALGDRKNAARSATNLSQLHLTLGDIRQAVNYAEQSVALADRSGAAFERMVFRTALADALHQGGRISEADRFFQQAEQMQKEQDPGCPLLYSLQGFLYCDLLLAQGRHRDVRDRGKRMFERHLPSDSLVDIALDHLSLGRACLLEGDSGEAQSHLDEAVSGLRQAGRQDYLPHGLLARASLHRLKRDFAHAQRDLDEALLIATRGSMRLHEADCHLEQARLSLATGDLARASASLAAGRKIVQETGYHRRDAEVAELEKQL